MKVSVRNSSFTCPFYWMSVVKVTLFKIVDFVIKRSVRTNDFHFFMTPALAFGTSCLVTLKPFNFPLRFCVLSFPFNATLVAFHLGQKPPESCIKSRHLFLYSLDLLPCPCIYYSCALHKFTIMWDEGILILLCSSHSSFIKFSKKKKKNINSFVCEFLHPLQGSAGILSLLLNILCSLRIICKWVHIFLLEIPL